MSKGQLYPKAKLFCTLCGKEFLSVYRTGRGWKRTCCTKCTQGLNGLAKVAGRHWNWSGNNPSYRALHKRMHKEIPIPNSCAECGKSSKLDLANVTGKYKPEKKHWKYLCRGCHVKLDRTRNKNGQFTSDRRRTLKYFIA